MSAMSDYLEGQIRGHLFRTATFAKPSVLAIALCTSAPVDADTGALAGKEVTNANAYARVARNPLDANWTAASSTDGLTDNAADITFPTASGSWGTVSHMANCDSATHAAGNMLIHGALSASKAVGINDIFKFATGDLDFIAA